MTVHDDQQTEDFDFQPRAEGDPTTFGPRRRVDLPVFHPRRPHRTLRVIVASTFAAAITITAVWAVHRLLGDQRAAAASVAVLGTSVTVAPENGILRCPDGRATFTATVRTNGAPGELRYQWTRPDQTVGVVSSLAVKPDERIILLALQFNFSGDGHASGVAVFRVVDPGQSQVSAPSVSYTCP